MNCHKLGRSVTGLLLSLFAGFCVAFSATLYRLTTNSRSTQAWFLRFVLMYVFCLPLLSYQSHRNVNRRLTLKLMMWLIFFATVAMVASVTFYLSLDYLTVSESVALCNSYPLPTFLFSCLCMRERHHPMQYGLLFLVLVGLFVLARPTFLFGQDVAEEIAHEQATGQRWIGFAFSIACSVFTGVRIIVGEFLRDNKVNVSQINIATSMAAFVVYPIYTAIQMEDFYIPCFADLIFLILSAFFGFLSNTIILVACQFERSGPVSLAYTSQIVFAFILDALVVVEDICITDVFGAGCIMAGVCGSLVVKMIRPGFTNEEVMNMST
ncbi:solute carrier family 35 member G1-like [Ciona intestinalis]